MRYKDILVCTEKVKKLISENIIQMLFLPEQHQQMQEVRITNF